LEAFDQTYKDHLKELAKINLADRSKALELEMRSASLTLPFFGHPHFISRPIAICFSSDPPKAI
jgi:hypothetical protein